VFSRCADVGVPTAWVRVTWLCGRVVAKELALMRREDSLGARHLVVRASCGKGACADAT